MSAQSILCENIFQSAKKIARKQYDVPTEIYRTQLPIYPKHHISLFQGDSKLSFFTSANIFQMIQYHPFYHQIMSEVNRVEQTMSCYESRPCFQMLSGGFIPIKIRDTIFSYYKYLSVLTSEIDDIVVNLHIITRQIWDDAALLEVLAQVKLILLTVWSVYSVKKISPINIYFYPTKFKKKLPKLDHFDPTVLAFLKSEARMAQRKGYRIDIDNYENTTSVAEVNSAMCYRDYGIVIWREEDWASRLCHELIHFYDLEKTRLPDIGKKFALNNQVPINPNELVTEAQTYFIWTVFRTVQQNVDRDQIRRWISEDQYHQIHMAYRFCKRVGLSLSTDEPVVFNNCSELSHHNNGAKCININSNAFYYVVLRGCLWINIDETVLDLIIPNRNLSVEQLSRNLVDKIGVFGNVVKRNDSRHIIDSLCFYPVSAQAAKPLTSYIC